MYSIETMASIQNSLRQEKFDASILRRMFCLLIQQWNWLTGESNRTGNMVKQLEGAGGAEIHLPNGRTGKSIA
ncbi:hypothetical protein ACFU8X_02255 [Brevibacillus porteri]|uniref:hypothetical protein n=1 Tax=Brevibacillus porteri TaxID=2126350 RepID=UPI00370A9FBC